MVESNGISRAQNNPVTLEVISFCLMTRPSKTIDFIPTPVSPHPLLYTTGETIKMADTTGLISGA